MGYETTGAPEQANMYSSAAALVLQAAGVEVQTSVPVFENDPYDDPRSRVAFAISGMASHHGGGWMPRPDSPSPTY